MLGFLVFLYEPPFVTFDAAGATPPMLSMRGPIDRSNPFCKKCAAMGVAWSK